MAAESGYVCGFYADVDLIVVGVDETGRGCFSSVQVVDRSIGWVTIVEGIARGLHTTVQPAIRIVYRRAHLHL